MKNSNHAHSSSPSCGRGFFHFFKKSSKKKGELMYGEMSESPTNSPDTKRRIELIRATNKTEKHLCSSYPPTRESCLSEEDRELALGEITRFKIPTIICEPPPDDLVPILRKKCYDSSGESEEDGEEEDDAEFMIPGLTIHDFEKEIHKSDRCDDLSAAVSSDHEHGNSENRPRKKKLRRSVSWDPDVKDNPERSCSYRKFIEGWHRDYLRQQRERRHKYEEMQRKQAWKEPECTPYRMKSPFMPLAGFSYPCDMIF